jgi:prevent-host-death family protein
MGRRNHVSRFVRKGWRARRGELLCQQTAGRIMPTFTIHAAKTNLSKLLARVEAGEEIVVARGKTPIARLTRIHSRPAKRCFRAFKGVVSVGPEFFEPLTSDQLADWE